MLASYSIVHDLAHVLMRAIDINQFIIDLSFVSGQFGSLVNKGNPTLCLKQTLNREVSGCVLAGVLPSVISLLGLGIREQGQIYTVTTSS